MAKTAEGIKKAKGEVANYMAGQLSDPNSLLVRQREEFLSQFAEGERDALRKEFNDKVLGKTNSGVEMAAQLKAPMDKDAHEQKLAGLEWITEQVAKPFKWIWDGIKALMPDMLADWISPKTPGQQAAEDGVAIAQGVGANVLSRPIIVGGRAFKFSDETKEVMQEELQQFNFSTPPAANVSAQPGQTPPAQPGQGNGVTVTHNDVAPPTNLPARPAAPARGAVSATASGGR